MKELQSIEVLISLNNREKLIQYLQKVFVNNLPALIQLLYKLDVDENKLKNELSVAEIGSLEIIADLIIKRQLQKNLSKKTFYV